MAQDVLLCYCIRRWPNQGTHLWKWWGCSNSNWKHGFFHWEIFLRKMSTFSEKTKQGSQMVRITNFGKFFSCKVQILDTFLSKIWGKIKIWHNVATEGDHLVRNVKICCGVLFIGWEWVEKGFYGWEWVEKRYVNSCQYVHAPASPIFKECFHQH